MSQIKIGWAKREVSTTEPVSMAGQMYLRISEGILDPLYVTALCVDGGEGQDAVIFCACDVVVLRGGIIKLTREKVAAKNPEIPLDNIIMNATHTHSGGKLDNDPTSKSPDGKDIYPSSQYREFYAERAAEAIVEAWETRKEGGIAFGYGFAVVAHSRRSMYSEDMSKVLPNSIAPNGHVVMYGNTALPRFVGYEAGADHFINLLYTFDENQKLTGIIVNIPCPSQLSEHFTKLSADYWHDVREAVKKEYGEDVFVLPQCAAAGDLSPRTLHYKEAQIRRMTLKYNLPYDLSKCKEHKTDEYNKVMSERYDITERIMNAVNEVYDWAKKDIRTEVPVGHVKEIFPVKRRFITKEEKEWCERNIEEMRDKIPTDGTPEELRVAVTRYNSCKRRNMLAIQRYETQNENPTIDMEMHIFRIGDCGFSTCRFEYYMDFATQIQARSPFLQTFVIQLAGDEGGSYLATERAQQNKGYGASLFCNQASFEGGQDIAEETLRVLGELKSKEQ